MPTKSIFTTFTGLHKAGSPLDLLATWRKTFDKASEREVALFQKMYTDGWFTYNTPQMSLTAEAIVGKYQIRFMATLLGDESPSPLRRSDGFDVWTKEIPRVGQTFVMFARDYRKLMEVYENPRLKEADKVKQIEKTLTHQMQDAYLGCKDVMDFIVLMAFSNWGVAQFVPAINNPGGRAYEVDYTMPDANKLVSVLNWTTANVKAGKLNPILFLSVLCAALRARGVQPGEILMSQELATWLRMNDATRLLAHGTDKQAQTVTKSEFSALLEENEIPPPLPLSSARWVSPRTASVKLLSRGIPTLSQSSPPALSAKSSPLSRTPSLSRKRMWTISTPAMVFVSPSGAQVHPRARPPANTPRARAACCPLSPRLGRLFAYRYAA